MLRLAHRILNQRTIPDVYPEWSRKAAVQMFTLSQELLRRRCPVILADNVAVYLNERRRDGEKSPLFADYPPSPPPFNIFFIESNLPPVVHFRQPDRAVTTKEFGYFQEGALFLTESRVERIRADTRLINDYGKENTEKARWLLVGQRFAAVTNGIALPYVLMDILLDENGHIIVCAARPLIDDQWIGDGDAGAAVFLMTMSFLQCKNVACLDSTESEGPSPKWCRRQNVPELKYHTLQIDPNISARPRAGERKTEGDRSGKALHICRGHFAHFVDDGVSIGLFGRRQFGTFWIPAHTRGSLEHGSVVSTYNVKVPCNS